MPIILLILDRLIPITPTFFLRIYTITSFPSTITTLFRSIEKMIAPVIPRHSKRVNVRPIVRIILNNRKPWHNVNKQTLPFTIPLAFNHSFLSPYLINSCPTNFSIEVKTCIHRHIHCPLPFCHSLFAFLFYSSRGKERERGREREKERDRESKKRDRTFF